jgi:hypothetical protein
LLRRSWTYTVSSTTTGVDAKMPEKLGVATKRKRQRAWSFATLPALMLEPSAARVAARSRLGSGHEARDLSAPQPQRMNATTAASGVTRRTIR